jgi:hypothetical protein
MSPGAPPKILAKGTRRCNCGAIVRGTRKVKCCARAIAGHSDYIGAAIIELGYDACTGSINIITDFHSSESVL